MADLLHFQSRVSPRVSRRQSGRIGGLLKINMSAALLARVRSSNEIREGDKIFLEARNYLFITHRCYSLPRSISIIILHIRAYDKICLYNYVIFRTYTEREDIFVYFVSRATRSFIYINMKKNVCAQSTAQRRGI